MKGRKAIPIAVLRARGSWRAKARAAAGEPQPEVGEYPAPKWLSKEARRFWTRTVKQLAAVRVASRMDEAAFTRYCALWCRWRVLEEFLIENGQTRPAFDSEGHECGTEIRPECNLSDKLGFSLLRLEQEFGLTPAARSKVKSAPEAKAPAEKLRFFGEQTA